jgi:uncharacterized protein (DUF2141 family)
MMIVRRLFTGAAVLALFVCALAAADVTGKWTAEVPGRDGNTRTMTMVFKADGDKLTGTVSTPRGESEIQDGKVSGDDISFVQKANFGGNEVVIKYTGKVSGDEIKMTRQMGERPANEFTAKRAK